MLTVRRLTLCLLVDVRLRLWVVFSIRRSVHMVVAFCSVVAGIRVRGQ